MFRQLTLQRFLDLAKSESRIAIYKEISGDKITPISSYNRLANDHQNISILESCGKGPFGRYSYLCLHPYDVFTSTENESSDPFELLHKKLSVCNCYYEHPLCRYTGGAIGFISYDAIRLIESIPDSNISEIDIPELFFRFYATNIAFDHESGKVVISTMVDVGGDPKVNYQTGMQRVDQLISKINFISISSNDKNKSIKSQNNLSEIIVDINDEEYMQLVQKAKQYIVDGDAFQIVLSRTFKRQFTAKPFDIYRALRITNSSPYMFYIEHDDFVVVGASPEKLVSIKDNKVETNPIAGTRPRDINELNDTELADDLLQDKKEIAEHMMLVDLGRNDLGAVCVPGSVKVKKVKEIQKFSRVMHITSLVEGELDKNKNFIDVIKAVFPAGTLSGAPKIRAMEIIDELETSKRGLYGGAICIIDNQMNLNSCIAIRMAVLQNNMAYVRAGAGIVYDSDPKKEAEETKHKAQAVLEAIDLAEGGM
jgi:anthranilate synthase component 1